jgi:hypothetical protein
VPIFGNAIEETHDYSREFSSGHERFLRVGETDPSHVAVGKAGNLSGVKFFYVVRVDTADSRVVGGQLAATHSAVAYASSLEQLSGRCPGPSAYQDGSSPQLDWGLRRSNPGELAQTRTSSGLKIVGRA